MNVAELLAEKREAIKAVCAKHGAFNVRVFGSAARGDFDDKSDIDILIKLDSSGFEGFQYFRVLDDLTAELESLLGHKVDVVDESGLRERIRSEVLSEAIAL